MEELGCDEIVLETEITNQPALRQTWPKFFFEKKNFKKSEKLKKNGKLKEREMAHKKKIEDSVYKL